MLNLVNTFTICVTGQSLNEGDKALHIKPSTQPWGLHTEFKALRNRVLTQVCKEQLLGLHLITRD